jgi:hypothetical protein
VSPRGNANVSRLEAEVGGLKGVVARICSNPRIAPPD